MFPVLEPELCERVQEMLDIQLADTAKARVLLPDGTTARIPCTVGESVRSQERLMLVTRARAKSGAPDVQDRGPLWER